jgi:CHASE3 domain sensor protein
VVLISFSATTGTPGAKSKRAVGQTFLLAAGFLVLVAVSTLSVILVNRAREDNDWVVHTLEVENQISTLLLRIRTTESAARGYLLTEEQRFLDEYQATAASVHSDIDKLIKQAGDNPVQIDNSNQLRQPVQARLDEFEKAIGFAKRHDTAGPSSASMKLPVGCGRKKSACSCCAPPPRTARNGLRLS